MNGIEALDNMIETFDCGGYHPATIGCKHGAFKEVFGDELPIIELELKVLQILKENSVDLELIDYWRSKTTTLEELLYRYNDRAYDWVGDLTFEEMQLIVDWLEEQPIAHFTRDVFREDQRSK